MASITLDKYDLRLLYELDKNSSQPISTLANKIKRSKQFVFYRLQNLEQEKIITGYHAIIDMSKLGYFTFRIYLKLQKMTLEDHNKLVEYIKYNFKQVWTITSMHGKWDLAIFLGVEHVVDFHNFWDELLKVYKENIHRYNVAVYAPIINFNRKFFLKMNEEPIERIYGAGTPEKIDEVDRKIVEAYGPNVRNKYTELSTVLKVSPDIVRRRIKSLEERKIIVGYKLGLNLEKLGYVGYRVDLQLNSTKINKELLEYCKMHTYIYQINKSIGGADFEIEVIVRDLQHLLEVIDELKKKFKDVINDAEWFGFSTFHILKYIPD